MESSHTEHRTTDTNYSCAKPRERRESEDNYKPKSDLSSQHAQPLNGYETFGWKAIINLSEDENYMDLVLLLTRSSQLKQGGMACILVQPSRKEEQTGTTDVTKHMVSRIISVGLNQPLYRENESDIHAEIVAICQVAKNKNANNSATCDSTAYITMPPCKRCFAALISAGINRIVSRYPSPEQLRTVAKKHHIEMTAIPENRDRLNAIVRIYQEETQQELYNKNK